MVVDVQVCQVYFHCNNWNCCHYCKLKEAEACYGSSAGKESPLYVGAATYEGFLGGDRLLFHRRTGNPKLQNYLLYCVIGPCVAPPTLSPREQVPTDKRIMWPVNGKKCFHCLWANYAFFKSPKTPCYVRVKMLLSSMGVFFKHIFLCILCMKRNFYLQFQFKLLEAQPLFLYKTAEMLSFC